jgi:hypothetical protein
VGTRLHRRPVHGSVVLGLLPSEPQPRAAWASLLRVSSTSPGKARDDTELFLANWQGIPDGFSDIAVLLVSELVTNAYKAMEMGPISGIACIELSLRLLNDHLLIEVIDSSPKTPAPNLTDDAEREGWRGLAVVDRLSQEWGYFWRMGRKVVFCKLSIPSPDEEN